jgi:phospholipid-binding lipoprotein MlaA
MTRYLTGAIEKIAACAVKTWTIGALVVITGCATGPNANPSDPLEPLNRKVAALNSNLDRAVLKPVATGYAAITPDFVRAGVNNFFSNVSDAWTTVNSVLQLKGQKAGESFTRVALNTFFGFGGLLDIASEMGVEKHQEDLGRTLGRWGVPSGPYLVLPLFGPSTVRDALTITAETQYDPIGNINNTGARTSLNALRLVNTRSNYLRLGNVLEDASLDPYTFSRDAFLARRQSEINRSKDVQDSDSASSYEEPDDKTSAKAPATVDKPQDAPAGVSKAPAPASSALAASAAAGTVAPDAKTDEKVPNSPPAP